MRELTAYTLTGEQPDAIGFKTGFSILIECKTSRADFLADKKKMFRRKPNNGMGNYRFYMCPEGLIEDKELPEKWGLLWVSKKGRVKMISGPNKDGNIWGTDNYFTDIYDKGESLMKDSALRRIQKKKLMQEIYNK